MLLNGNIIITGGSSGLGLALAEMLLKEGAQIGIVALDTPELKVAVENLREYTHEGKMVTCHAADVSNELECATAIKTLADQLGGIDILINCAGILREGYFENLALETFQAVMNVNVYGVINATKAALPFLKESRGRLVNIASMGGLSGVFGYTPYCTSKHAVVGLTDSLWYELGPQGITVQVICPPEFDSPMVDELNKDRTPENRMHTLLIPKASVETIARSTINGIRSGQYLTVPGGYSARVSAWAMRHFPKLLRRVANKKIEGVYVGPAVLPET